jgi:hypothetical protein
MLIVNSGWLGPKTITTPLVKGIVLSSRETAITTLRALKSAAENNFLIRIESLLNQFSPAFKGV